MRVLGSEQMSDDENRLARKAICMSQVLGDLSIRAIVRNDNELDEKIKKITPQFKQSAFRHSSFRKMQRQRIKNL